MKKLITLDTTDTFDKVASYIQEATWADMTTEDMIALQLDLEKSARANGYILTDVRNMIEAEVENKIEREYDDEH